MIWSYFKMIHLPHARAATHRNPWFWKYSKCIKTHWKLIFDTPNDSYTLSKWSYYHLSTSFFMIPIILKNMSNFLGVPLSHKKMTYTIGKSIKNYGDSYREWNIWWTWSLDNLGQRMPGNTKWKKTPWAILCPPPVDIEESASHHLWQARLSDMMCSWLVEQTLYGCARKVKTRRASTVWLCSKSNDS